MRVERVDSASRRFSSSSHTNTNAQLLQEEEGEKETIHYFSSNTYSYVITKLLCATSYTPGRAKIVPRN